MDFRFDEGSPLPCGWICATAGEFRRKRSITFNPTTAKDDKYELWSIPSYSSGNPEIVTAQDIGSNKQYVEPGDVLVSRINPRLNRTWVVRNSQGFVQIASTEWVVFPCRKEINPHFLATLLSTYRIRDFLAANASGVGGSLTRARPELFDKIGIPMPPINEQRRIVKKIDELFTEIDQGVKNLQATKQKLVLYRQSLLKSAFEGRLTAEWRKQNADKLESPEALLARIHQERESRHPNALNAWQQAVTKWQASGKQGKKPPKPKPLLEPKTLDAFPDHPSPRLDGVAKLPSRWIRVRLAEICEINPRTDKIALDLDSAVSFVPMSAVEAETGRIDISETRPFETVKKGYTPFRTGDILFAKITPCMENGKMAIVPELLSICGFGSTEFHILRPFAGVNTRLIYYAVSRRAFRFHAEHNMTGAVGQKRVPAIVLESHEIGLPPTQEQTEIVRILDCRLEAAERLNTEIDTNLNRAEALRQSILKQAFSGQLVPQDPNDEPASKLLARIKTEQAKSPASKRRKRTTAA